MLIHNIVENILGKYLKKQNFELDIWAEEAIWEYKRENVNYTESILLAKPDPEVNYLTLEIRTSRYFIYQFLSDENYRRFPFPDENTLEKLLNYFIELLETKLKLMGLPPYTETIEFDRKLFHEHKQLTEIFQKKYNINMKNDFITNLKILQKIIDIKNSESNYTDREFLLSCAAMLGELIKSKLNSYWLFDEKDGASIFIHEKVGSINPLYSITYYWGNPELHINTIGDIGDYIINILEDLKNGLYDDDEDEKPF